MTKRKYLTFNEVKLIANIASESRNAERDTCMIYMAYIHGLRVSELISLKICDLDVNVEKIYINRLKNGFSNIHPIYGVEKKLLHTWLNVRNSEPYHKSQWLFLSKKGRKITRQYFYKLIKRYAEICEIPINVHPHMLRHGCGFALADQGMDTRLIQDFLGHRNIRHTVLYTAGNSARFLNAWSKK